MWCTQAMPSLPPLAATRSMSGSTMVHPHATHSALQPTLPASSSAAPQTPAPPLSYATGTSTVFPEILPLLQSISSRLQRSDERLAHLETTLDARLQDAVRSGSAAAAEAAPPQVAGALDVTPQEGASTPAGGASPEANGHMGKSNAGVPSSMVSPFANGPGVGDAALRTQSVPSVMEGPSLGESYPQHHDPIAFWFWGAIQHQWPTGLSQTLQPLCPFSIQSLVAMRSHPVVKPLQHCSMTSYLTVDDGFLPLLEVQVPHMPLVTRSESL